MKFTFPFALTAALIFGCSSASKNTKTAANDTGTTQSGSIEGTQAAAGGANGTQATAATGTAAPGSTAATSVPADSNAAPSTASGQAATAQNGTTASGTASGSTSGVSGSASGDTSGATTALGSTPGASGTVGSSSTTAPDTSGSVASSSGSTAATADNAGLKTVTGAVAKVDTNSITLDQAAGGVTLTVDSQTQVLRRGQPISAGISAIHEGQQIRASFDPASNRADKIEVIGRGMKHHHMGSSSTSDTSAKQPSDSTKPGK